VNILEVLGMKSRARALAYGLFCTAVGVVFMALLGTCATGCGGPQQRHRIARVAITGAGAAVDGLAAANRRLYRTQGDELIDRLRARGATAADFERETAALDNAFKARSDILVQLAADLYAAAAIADTVAAGGSAASLREAVARVVATLETALVILSDGHVMPPLPIPESIRIAVLALRQLVGAPDAGAEDGGYADAVG
jgi:hypothetical protein